MDKPKFRNMCDTCEFIGRYNDHDLYFCKNNPTVVARYSDKDVGYISGISSDKPELIEAKKIAIEKGLYKPNHKNKSMDKLKEINITDKTLNERGITNISVLHEEGFKPRMVVEYKSGVVENIDGVNKIEKFINNI